MVKIEKLGKRAYKLTVPRLCWSPAMSLERALVNFSDEHEVVAVIAHYMYFGRSYFLVFVASERR